MGGSTAQLLDLADLIGERLPLIIAVVVGLSMLLLLVAFRSVVAPLQAALVNLLSVGAAYGILTAVFQEGHGATAIGLDGAIPIVSYVPMMMFAILFGLAMDYQVFLLSRVREEVDAGKSPARPSSRASPAPARSSPRRRRSWSRSSPASSSTATRPSRSSASGWPRRSSSPARWSASSCPP